MHYAKAPAIDTTYRVRGGVTFGSIRRAIMDRRMKRIEKYINEQTAQQPAVTTPEPKPTILQRIKSFFS